MALLSGDDYVESLKAFSPEIYFRGERVDRVWDHPLLRQTVGHLRAGFDQAFSSETRDRFAVTSPLTGTLLGFTINAAGSPVTNKIVVNRLYDLESRIDIARQIAGVN